MGQLITTMLKSYIVLIMYQAYTYITCECMYIYIYILLRNMPGLRSSHMDDADVLLTSLLALGRVGDILGENSSFALKFR